MKHQPLFVALLCATTSVAHAEKNDMLDEIVVTATRMPQALTKTISHTTVITEQEIRQSGATDVPRLLRQLSGIEVVQSGGIGAQSSTYMRGANSNQTLVLIDGVRINSATAGTTALEHILLDSIERIEVVRGNISSLYGSEAIGGVIQIFTKQSTGQPSLTASAGAGTHGTTRMAAGFSGQTGENQFSLSAGQVKTDGISAINPQLEPKVNPNSNGYINNSINAQVKHSFDAKNSLGVTWFTSRGDTSFDDAYGVTSDLNNTLSNLDKFSLFVENQLSQSWKSKVQLSQGSDESRNIKNGTQSSRYKTNSSQFSWLNTITISDTQLVNAGFEYLGQEVGSTTQYSQTTRHVNSGLLGYVAEYGAQQVQLNLRQDNFSDFGTANTGLLGYGFIINDHWRTTANVSSAFKAPTFNDLFAPNSWGSNPNLRPEQSQSQEIGLHYTNPAHQLKVTYFDNQIRDLIASQSGVMTNINKAQITGQELSYVGSFGNKQIKAYITLQDPRNSATGAVLSKRAKQYASFSASHNFGTWYVGIGARYSGERLDGTHVLSSYHLVDLSARYTINQHLDLAARVDNVFDREYTEAYSYNTLGRTLFVSLSYQ